MDTVPPSFACGPGHVRDAARPSLGSRRNASILKIARSRSLRVLHRPSCQHALSLLSGTASQPASDGPRTLRYSAQATVCRERLRPETALGLAQTAAEILQCSATQTKSSGKMKACTSKSCQSRSYWYTQLRHSLTTAPELSAYRYTSPCTQTKAVLRTASP